MKRIILVALLFAVVPIAGAQVYTITDLGAFTPTAINAWAQVVGNYNNHAFMWTKFGGLKDLGILANGTFSSPNAVNDLGVAVGTADGPVTFVSSTGRSFTCTVPQGFVWKRLSGMKGLGLGPFANACIEPTPSIVSYATGINDFGQVADTIDWGSNTFVDGFLWTQSGGLELLPGPSTVHLPITLTEVNGVNNYGQMAGAVGCCTTLSMAHAVFWGTSGTFDLGTLGDDTFFYSYCSKARAINDVGQIVGWSTTVQSTTTAPCQSSNSPHAFVWTNNTGMQDLGTLPSDTMSMALANNFFGQVIGTSGNAVVDDPYRGSLGMTVVGRPFIWTQRGGMQDLNDLINSTAGWVLNNATGINIWGQIVGQGTLNGQSHGYLLTPKLVFNH